MANKGLGRGLGSLLGILDDDNEVQKQEAHSPVQNQFDGEEVVDLNMGLIDINPNQPRKNFDPTALSELAVSIKTHGLIQPILVTPRGDRYLIVAGERRFRASKLAEKKTIKAIIRELDETQVKEIALLENIQRQDLNPIETARALKELGETYGWTQEALADRLGKSRSVIANTLRLLTLCPEVIDLIEKGKLSAGHARSLVVVTNPEVQLKLANQVINNKLTVRDMENAVKQVDKTERKVIKSKPQMSMEMREFVDIMEHKFSTKINVKGNDNKGKIIINYYNQDDLNRIYDIIASIHN